MPIRYTTLGTIEGRLVAISVASGAKFVIYHHISNKAVLCTFPDNRLDEVKESLGRNAIASGTINYNVRREPVQMECDLLRMKRSKDNLPTILSTAGSDPNFTGVESTSEYIRSIRGE